MILHQETPLWELILAVHPR
uniref:Uncharacterized protein n=1 Tax=Rhizophora mucronata TaxID=61149 RepID=A0A2P2P776_RHIMU